jgi:TonB family protein
MATQDVSNDVLNRSNFGLLPEPKGRWGSFGVSAISNAVAFALLFLFTMSQIHKAQVQKYDTTQLIFPVETPKPVIPPAPKIRTVAPPQPPKLEQPKIQIPKPEPMPEPKVQVKLNNPTLPNVPPAPPKRVTPPPQPKVGLFASPTPTPVANNKTAPSPKTGGFGDPVGVTPNPTATRPATIAAAGNFNYAPGAGQGAGAARRGAVQGTAFGSGVANGVPGGTSRGTVASAGFSNGQVGGVPGGVPGGSRGGNVATGGFNTQMAAASTPVVAKQNDAPTTSVVVLSKPLPQYTAEARQLHIEGDVTLKVRFTATGQVQVLQIVNGLGHGLDEQARRVVEQIRFKPALKGGQPVDQVSLIHVTFQLA